MTTLAENPIANWFAEYNNPNPTLQGLSYTMPPMGTPSISDPTSFGMAPLPGQPSVGFNTSFDPNTYMNEINKYGQNLDSGFGMNMPTFQLGLSGLMGLGNLYGAYQSNKLANKSFDYSKSTADKNYKNTVASYNTALEDQRNVRGVMEGKSQAQVQSEIERNRLA